MPVAGGSPRQRVTALCAPAGPRAEEVRAMSATMEADFVRMADDLISALEHAREALDRAAKGGAGK